MGAKENLYSLNYNCVLLHTVLCMLVVGIHLMKILKKIKTFSETTKQKSLISGAWSHI